MTLLEASERKREMVSGPFCALPSFPRSLSFSSLDPFLFSFERTCK